MAARIVVPEIVELPYEYYRDNVAKSLELFDELNRLGKPRLPVLLYRLALCAEAGLRGPGGPGCPDVAVRPDQANDGDVPRGHREGTDLGDHPALLQPDRLRSRPETGYHLRDARTWFRSSRRPRSGTARSSRSRAPTTPRVTAPASGTTSTPGTSRGASPRGREVRRRDRGRGRAVHLYQSAAVTASRSRGWSRRSSGCSARGAEVEAPPRPGDAVGASANADKAAELLGWRTESTLEQALASALAWGEKRKEILGYE